jgi:acyl CoA:acetate/3-ketoacid CoA transferase alpha subunit
MVLCFSYISEFSGLGPVGMSMWLYNGQVKSVINSYPGPNVDILDRLHKGEIRLEVMPQVRILNIC